MAQRPNPPTAAELGRQLSAGQATASRITAETIADIKTRNGALNAFTSLTTERAVARARAIDAAITAGASPGSLAGVPFGVKNLFDVAGLSTRAGSLINRNAPPATRDATLIERLEAQGAILVGALNMGEFAYDFTGENVHDGPSRNPHDLKRMSGGSSGGSGAAVAAGLVPLALGSDTNGSIRVPASLCGIFGLKPTFGRLSRHGTFPFVSSLDHVGPLARCVDDLARAYDAMQGHDPADPVSTSRAREPTLPAVSTAGTNYRIAVAGGYFDEGLSPEAVEAMKRVCAGLDARHVIEIPEAARARASAFLITAAEGAALHLDRLRSRGADFDPAVRDRLIAGAMVPGAIIQKAQKLRRWYREKVVALFDDVDAILAPATPCTAPLIGQETFEIAGRELPVRPNLGIYTQPISFIGLPTVVVPVPLDPLPIGIQIITAPWREDIAISLAARLEREGIAALRPL